MLTWLGKQLRFQKKYHIIISSHGGWNRQLEEEALNLQTHVLHGLIHCNRYIHLLFVNFQTFGDDSRSLQKEETCLEIKEKERRQTWVFAFLKGERATSKVGRDLEEEERRQKEMVVEEYMEKGTRFQFG
ncbi:PHD finger protein At2g01810 [Linum grandiflorum]